MIYTPRQNAVSQQLFGIQNSWYKQIGKFGFVVCRLEVYVTSMSAGQHVSS